MAILIRAARFAPALLLGLALAATATARPLPLWEIEGTSNRVLLMGSVHFLRPTDYPLREGMDEAFRIADTLIMEINMSEVDPLAQQSAIAALTIDGEGRGLRELLGDKDYKKAAQLADDIGIPLMMFDQFEPWFAALTITQMRMVQLGFDPSWGIETMFTRRALADNKSLDGLETLEQQLGFMDTLDAATQREFLLQSLEDAATVQDQVETIVDAWAAGDIAGMEQELLKGLDEVPELYEAILVQRNRNWIEPIAALRNRDDDYLVIVGAMHLVGEDSVIAMLEDKGISTRQLTDADF